MEYQLNPEDMQKLNSDNSKKYRWKSAKISRLSTPKITIEDKLLVLKIAVKLSGKLNYTHCTTLPFFKDISCIDADTDFSMIVDISTKIDIDITPNWTLSVKDIEELSIDVKNASASLYGVDIPITFIINKIIKAHSHEFIPTITKNIEKISIKDKMEDIWYKMHIKKKIPNENIWFHFIPKDIAFAKSYRDNTITFHPKIIGEARVVTDSNYSDSYQKLTLPNLKKSNPKDSNFSIKLPIALEYNELSKMIAKKIKNRHIKTNGFEIFISNIKFYSRNKKIYIDVQFYTDFKFNLLNTEGVITLTGIPQYNIKTDKLNIKELEYSLETKERLVSIGSLLWYKYFKNKLEELLTHDIAQTSIVIKKYRDIINKKVTSFKLYDDIELNGDINKLGFDNIYLDNTNIVIILNITGELNVTYSPSFASFDPKDKG